MLQGVKAALRSEFHLVKFALRRAPDQNSWLTTSEENHHVNEMRANGRNGACPAGSYIYFNSRSIPP